MISLIKTPQRADIKAEYTISNDILTVTIADKTEIFDFTGLADGRVEEIVAEALPVNPIVSVEKIDATVNITVIRFYSEDEKEIYEVQNG